jgi:methylamine dehydrogenase accessory protein MauD
MDTLWLVSYLALWGIVLLLGFLLLGTLRTLALMGWRIDQLEATMPSRVGRSGLKPGRKAPQFTLADVDGQEVSLADYRGRRVLLVFVQPGCGPCGSVVPVLNQVEASGEAHVLAINRADPTKAHRWAEETGAAFPVLVQEKLDVSKRYEMLSTPFAFLIDAEGVIVSSGIVNNRQHVRFLFSAARERSADEDETNEEPKEQAVAV